MRRRRIALAVAATGVGVWLAELSLRALRPEVAHTRDAAWKARLDAMHDAVHETDAALVYVPRPGARVEMDYGAVAVTAEGFRAPAVEQARGGDAVRVAVLGDSLVWGELLGPDQTVPAALGRALGPEFAVWNAGVTGYDTRQEAGWYRRAVRPHHPDVVVLVVCLNDLLVMSGPLHRYGTPADLDRWEAERGWIEREAPLRNETVSALWLRDRRGGGSQVLAALRHLQRWHSLYTLPGGYTDELLVSHRDPGRRERAAAALHQLGQDLDQDGVTALLVVSPALYWWHRYPWDEAHAFWREAGEDAGFAVLDPLPDWRGQDPTALRFAGDNLHYTAAGAEWFAGWLAPRLRDAVRQTGPRPQPDAADPTAPARSRRPGR